MTVNSIKEAWEMVNEIFPTDYTENTIKTKNAGYPVFDSNLGDENGYICDLGNRLEVNLADGTTVNIWIETAQEKVKRIVKEHNEKIDYFMNVTLAKELNCKDGKVNINDWFKVQELINRQGFYISAKAILDTLRAFGYDVKIDMQTNKLVF